MMHILTMTITMLVLFYLNSNSCDIKDFNSIKVKTSSGIVRGNTIKVLNKNINQFWSIPYAEPPIGRLRFGKTRPLRNPLKSVIDATKPKNSCFQMGMIEMLHDNSTKSSEDCLILNIWSNKAKNKQPVMVWIHGGGFVIGSSYVFNGKWLATYGVVVVTLNYRLGPFGFLYGGDDSAPANAGLYDQNMALKWVKQNIRSFGGDPNQVTLFGESAGSWSVSAHILSPISRDLFKRAIMSSGALFNYKHQSFLNKTRALSEAKEMAKHFKCSDKEWLKCLRKVNPKSISKYTKITNYPIDGTEFLPMSAQKAFKTHNYSKDIDIIAGVTKNEGSLLVQQVLATYADPNISTKKNFLELLDFTPIYGLTKNQIIKYYLSGVNIKKAGAIRSAFYNFYGDLIIVCPTYMFAKQFAKKSPKSRVYFYQLTYQGKGVIPMGCDPKTMGICHGADIEFVFGQPFDGITKSSKVDLDFSLNIMKMWTDFVKGIKFAQQIWPRLIKSGQSNTSSKIKELNPRSDMKVHQNLFKKNCEQFFKDYYL